MIKEISHGKKIFMVLFMMIIFLLVIVYLLRKASEKKEEADKRRARENERRHAESAIFEEQENKKVHEFEEAEKRRHMKHDMTSYDHYLNYATLHTWNKFTVKKEVEKTKPRIYSNNDDGVQPTQVEMVIYFQSFIKAFRVNVVSIRHLECFRTADSRLVKFKILLNKSNGVKDVEKSLTYDIQDEISIGEKFSFHMDESEMHCTRLYLSIWSIDVFYREMLLGALSINLVDYDCSVRQNIIDNVLPVKQDLNVYGYLLISMCHLPQNEKLICVVLSAKELRDQSQSTSLLNKTISPMVRVSLVNNGKLMKRHKTEVAIETDHPVYNEMIEFYIPSYQVKTSDVLFQVIHKENDNVKHSIGRVTIGNHSTDREVEHWNEVLHHPAKSIAKWHPVTR